ncbi:MAG: hypothetical protein R2697_06790 [Ilumatobacteraceae bacterium]
MTDEPLLDDSPLWLSALEHRAIRSVSRHGIRQFVLSQAALAVVVSVLLVVASWWILDGFETPDRGDSRWSSLRWCRRSSPHR